MEIDALAVCIVGLALALSNPSDSRVLFDLILIDNPVV